jgi:hypothetical protein
VIYNRVKDIIKILNVESEARLNYLIGQKISEIRHLQIHKSRFKSPFLHSILFFVRPFVKGWIDYFPSTTVSHVRYFIYAGTTNQLKSLEGFVKALSQRRESFKFVVSEGLFSESKLAGMCTPFRRRVVDVIISSFAMIIRYGKLREMLDGEYCRVNENYFQIFLESYLYLAYFLRVLKESCPEFVVVSNDHSVNNRSLLAVANYLGIKTVYMQHASVSSLFPALRFNYAFLDGEKSLQVYEECEKNSPGDIREYQKPKVYLSGQKKKVHSSMNVTKKKVGLAINMHDPINEVLLLIARLKEKNIDVFLRWHPRQDLIYISKIYDAFAEDLQVELSDPKTQDVAEYLHQVHTLIAGNSSIHLEAAIMDVRTIYYELVPPEMHDYYGYVKEKISLYAKSIEALLNILINKDVIVLDGRFESIKKYSESYGTAWYDKEGDLVYETLRRLTKGQELASIYGGAKNSVVFGRVFKLT